MARYVGVECFVCGNLANLQRCSLLFGPNTKRGPTKKHSLCNFCYYKLRHMVELFRGEAMNSLVLQIKYERKKMPDVG